MRRLPAADPDVLVEFELAVEFSDRSYAVTHRQSLSRLASSDLRLGANVPLLVDATDPTKLIIV